MILGGCSKSSRSDEQPPMEIEGVKVDTPALMSEFLEAPPDLYKQVSDATTDVRYNLHVEAMMQLEEVSKNPKLSAKQKELVTKVMEQLKQVIAKAPKQPNA